MKIWKKPNGNLVIELERNQAEITRFAYVLSNGARHYREKKREFYEVDDIYPRMAISAFMTSIMFDAYLIGSNYTQEFGTEEEPKTYHIKDFIANAIDGGSKFNMDDWNMLEIDIMKQYSWEDIV